LVDEQIKGDEEVAVRHGDLRGEQLERGGTFTSGDEKKAVDSDRNKRADRLAIIITVAR